MTRQVFAYNQPPDPTGCTGLASSRFGTTEATPVLRQRMGCTGMAPGDRFGTMRGARLNDGRSKLSLKVITLTSRAVLRIAHWRSRLSNSCGARRFRRECIGSAGPLARRT